MSCAPSPPLQIETIGDAYLAATGCIPHAEESAQENALRVARLAVALQGYCENFIAPDGSYLRMRIGLVTGPAMGGVVGATMLRYHLFGRLTQEVRGRAENLRAWRTEALRGSLGLRPAAPPPRVPFAPRRFV